MAERCPLKFNEHSIGHIPDRCLDLCAEKIDEAVRQAPVAGYDIYDLEIHSDCNPNCELETAQTSIAKLGNTAYRHYIITDECTDCSLDYGEKAFEFECPYN